MNQTKKRLSIINLAISMTDIETIQLQILKLGLLKSDDKIQEIIETLYETNYAKAQSLITEYIETPHHEILQRTFQKEREKFKQQKRTEERFQRSMTKAEPKPQASPKTEKELVDEFDLFHVPKEKSATTRTVIDLEDMIKMHDRNQNKPEKKEKSVDFDSLLNISSDDVMPNNIKIDLAHKNTTEDFWETDLNDLDDDPAEKDTFFDEEIPEVMTKEAEEPVSEKESETTETEEEEAGETSPDDLSNDPENEMLQDTDSEETEAPKETTEDENVQETAEEESEDEEKPVLNINYQAITYIDQKFKNMKTQYPLTEESDEDFNSVNEWLLQISNEGYSEEDIEAMMKKVDALREEHKAEAAQLLLISAATQSKYAQFRLARALYSGDLIERNLPEAFTLINRLAVNEDYPEAICDLAQFYEHGVGIGKDKKQAELLYREAMDLGIQRAEAHVKRLQKENKGFFSFMK